MTAEFVKTDTVLDRILSNTVREVAARKGERPHAEVERAAQAAPPPRDMQTALRGNSVALIAEVKHASPSKGVLVEPFDPVALATAYATNGAAALSVLTDSRFFQGSLGDLSAARAAVDVPILRKDFIVDPYQVYEARAAGADAILLIVAALSDAQIRDLQQCAAELGMAALVEVHGEEELGRALAVEPQLVGVNNRDLKTFDVTLDTTARLSQLVPPSITLVSESGIGSVQDIATVAAHGAQAILVGEALVTAADLPATVHAFSSVSKGATP